MTAVAEKRARKTRLGSEPVDPVKTQYDLMSRFSTKRIYQELSKAVGVTVDGLLRMATAVRILEDRGEDLNRLRLGLIDYLRLIGHGHVLAEAVVRFIDRPLLIRKVATLPRPDQVLLARGGLVVVVREEDGCYVSHEVDPITLTGREIYQVFANRRFRSPEEQEAFLKARRPFLPATVEVARTSRPEVIRIASRPVSVRDVRAALLDSNEAKLGISSLAKETVPVRLTALEKRALVKEARSRGLDTSTLIRRALLACGLLG